MNQINHLSSTSSLPLLLASTSPRRIALLKSLEIPFSQAAPTSEETVAAADNVSAVASQNAEAKAKSLLEAHPTKIVIGADTLVVLDDVVMGKPSSRNEVRENLRRLSGRTHSVLSGLALVSNNYGELKQTVTSRITFRDLNEEEIHAYSQTKEPMDKAGGYATQGLACRFVKNIEGSYWNIVGFPLEAFLDGIEKLTGQSVYSWFK